MQDAGQEGEGDFGIQKIVDSKTENGVVLYRVKWAPTWEPAENLAGCQHLVDQFWAMVNSTKVHEEEAKQQARKRMKPDPALDDLNSYRLDEDNKANIQQLIARTNATQSGGPALNSPSGMLNTSAQQSFTMQQPMNVNKTPNKMEDDVSFTSN